jgi:hypothetical protein
MAGERRPKNSELWLAKLTQDEELRVKELGILEVFPPSEPKQDEDLPVDRDPEE